MKINISVQSGCTFVSFPVTFGKLLEAEGNADFSAGFAILYLCIKYTNCGNELFSIKFNC